MPPDCAVTPRLTQRQVQWARLESNRPGVSPRTARRTRRRAHMLWISFTDTSTLRNPGERSLGSTDIGPATRAEESCDARCARGPRSGRARCWGPVACDDPGGVTAGGADARDRARPGW